MAEKAVENVNMSEDTSTEMFVRREALKDNNWTAGNFKNFSYAANSITGFRLDQEDRYTCLQSPNFTSDWSFFGVYDGHGGAVVAEYLKEKLHYHILEQLEIFGDMKTALEQGFQACDQAIRDMKEDEFKEIEDETLKEFSGSEYQPSTSGGTVCMSEELYAEIKSIFLKHLLAAKANANKAPSTSLRKESTEKNDKPAVRRSKRIKKGETASSSSHSDETDGKNAEPVLDEKKIEDEEIPLVGLSMGSTATAVVFTDEMLYVANVGDSRCIASINGKLLVLTPDHVPNNPTEKQRILESGHSITNNRVDGLLNMSRAFGDFTFKDKKNLMQKDQAVTAEPSISAIPINYLDFVVIASDGIWNEMASMSVKVFVAKSLYLPLEEIISETFERILVKKYRGLDNMTLIIIKNDEKCVKVSEQFRSFDDVETKEEENKKMKTGFIKSEVEEEENGGMTTEKTEIIKIEVKEEEENEEVETKKTKTRKSETNSKKLKIFKK